MSRRLAREYCFKLMFEYEFLKERNDISLSAYLEDEDLSQEEKEFVQKEYEGLQANNEKLNEIIRTNLKGYTLERLFKVDLAILKIAIYEICFSDAGTPKNVVINEAVELAKKYSTDKSYSFVNGLLANVCSDENLQKIGALNGTKAN